MACQQRVNKEALMTSQKRDNGENQMIIEPYITN